MSRTACLCFIPTPSLSKAMVTIVLRSTTRRSFFFWVTRKITRSSVSASCQLTSSPLVPPFLHYHYDNVMPKDTVTKKQKKSGGTPEPLFDSSTREYRSTRITTASNVASRPYTVHTQFITSLPQPLQGDFDEALYARTPLYEEQVNAPDAMDVDNHGAGTGILESGLPGVVIKQKVRLSKRYENSVSLILILRLSIPNVHSHPGRTYHYVGPIPG